MSHVSLSKFFPSSHISYSQLPQRNPLEMVTELCLLFVSTVQYPELMEVVHAVTSAHVVKLYETQGDARCHIPVPPYCLYFEPSSNEKVDET